MNVRHVRYSVALISIFAIGCAQGAKQSPQSPASAAPPETRAAEKSTAPSSMQPAYPGAPPPQSTPAPGISPQRQGQDSATGTSVAPEAVPRGSPFARFDDAERLLRTSGVDCATACKAFSSMQRAAVEICKMDGQGERCARANSALDAAREHLMGSCRCTDTTKP